MDPVTQNQSTFFIGTSGWTYDHWRGCFYPPDLPQKSWFDYYASRFSAVEVNATFYRTFSDETYRKWKGRAPLGFGYVLKAPKQITHRKFLVDVEQDIKTFYDSCMLLQDKFELIMLQLAPNMPINLERLHIALQSLPDPTRVAVEFRRKEWYCQEVLIMLREVGATICNVDSPRQQLTDHLTSDRAYLRLHGRKHWYSYDYSEPELKEIAILAQRLADRGAKRVYIFFNNDFEGHAPANARTLSDLLR